MEFCKNCNNMLDVKVNNEEDIPKLTYVCKHCDNVEISTSNVATQVYEIDVMNDNTSYMQYMMPHLKHDATLPRTDKIACTNPKCPTTKDESLKQEVIYIKYDKVNLKYLYHCIHCQTFWRSQ